MVILKPRPLPDHPDYKAACRQTVTLYNVYKIGSTNYYHKTVFMNSCRIEGARRYPINATGMVAQSSGLCVIPLDQGDLKFVYPKEFAALNDKTGVWTVQKNDKVLPGVGPDVSTSTEWSAIKAENYPDCFMISTIEYHKNLADVFVHIEVKPS